MVIHSDSLPQMWPKWEQLVGCISQCDGWESIEVYLTPAKQQIDIGEPFKRLAERERMLEYQDEDYSRPGTVPTFTVYYKSDEYESYSAAANPWRPEDAQRILGYDAEEGSVANVLATLKDLEAAEGVGADAFITGDDPALAYRDGLQERIRTLVMTPAEAGDYDTSDYFTDWGRYEFGDIHLLEPYKFVRSSLKELLLFYHEFLRLLDFPSLASGITELKERLDRAERQRREESKTFCVPFLLEPGIPAMHPELPKLFGGRSRASTSDDDSLARYGHHALFVESLYVGEPTQ